MECRRMDNEVYVTWQIDPLIYLFTIWLFSLFEFQSEDFTKNEKARENNLLILTYTWNFLT